MFPNYINLKKIVKNSKQRLVFKIPEGKVIKSKHIRIFTKEKIKKKFSNLFFCEKKFGPLDRLQIIKLEKNLFKISGRISIECN